LRKEVKKKTLNSNPIKMKATLNPARTKADMKKRGKNLEPNHTPLKSPGRNKGSEQWRKKKMGLNRASTLAGKRSWESKQD